MFSHDSSFATHDCRFVGIAALHQALVDGENVLLRGLTGVARRAHIVEGIMGQRLQIGFGGADFGDSGRGSTGSLLRRRSVRPIPR